MSVRTGHVLLAPDKFKGTLTARQVIAALAEGIRAHRPLERIVECPIADGGEGTLDAALGAGYEARHVDATDPLGRVGPCRYAVDGRRAVIEIGQVSGLQLVPPSLRDPCGSDTSGLGVLIQAALDDGCDRIVLGLGGSATNDGGAGVLHALGARILNSHGAPLPPTPRALLQAHELDLTHIDNRLAQTQLVLATDVASPLLGDLGASRQFATQKGAGRVEVELLEVAMTRWAALLKAATGLDKTRLAGLGAAGGTGFGLAHLMHTVVRPGTDFVFELVNFHELLEHARLVITGEGSLDQQTAAGKGPQAVARAAAERGIPIVAVCGTSPLSPSELHGLGFDNVHRLDRIAASPERALSEAYDLTRRAGELIARDGFGSSKRCCRVPT